MRHAGAQGFNPCRRAVGRIVVDEENFPIDTGERGRKASDQRLNIARLVIGGGDD
jgi:hypothetical protein